MAKNTSLFLRIGEAKELPAKDISGSSDPYCLIKVDNEEVARTATVWKNLNPFWGEEYNLHLPNGFQQLSVYIYDEDIVSGDDVIGRITLSRATLQNTPRGFEQWFPIAKIDKDKEVQGEIHLELARYNALERHYIRIIVKEARDLAVKDMLGSADPYVVVQVLNRQATTRKVKASRYPHWNESFEFDLAEDEGEAGTICVKVWDWDRVGGDDFMGQVDFQLADLHTNLTYDEWYPLSPKVVGDDFGSGDSGSIRLLVRLTEERILPSKYYRPLVNLLTDSVTPDKYSLEGPSPLRMIQDVATVDLTETANAMVKLYVGQGKVVEFLDALCAEEIQNTSNANTLFRGNTLATKSVDQFMKIAGMPYMHETLGPIVERIYIEHKLIELDPVKAASFKRRRSLIPYRDDEVLHGSRDSLLKYLTVIKKRLLGSAKRMPSIMRVVFKKIGQRIEQKWPDQEFKDYRYIGISGFLFLRFLAPAILSPKLFGLQEQHPNAKTSRSLTLLAKVIQTIGNLSLTSGVTYKEPWLEFLRPIIQESIPEVKVFIDDIVCIDDDSAVAYDLKRRRRSVFHPSVTIKQGYLWKRRWKGGGCLAFFAPRQRYFWLKYDSFAYSSKPTDQVRTTVLSQHIAAVERVDKYAFSCKNIGQIVHCNCHGNVETLYFKAKSINDLHSWISSIRKTVLTNDTLLETYHPGAYRRKQWTCCRQLNRQGPLEDNCVVCEAVGCSRTHARATIGDWRDPLDPDAEAQMVYSQLYHGQAILRDKYVPSYEISKDSVPAVVEQQSSIKTGTLLCIPGQQDAAVAKLQPQFSSNQQQDNYVVMHLLESKNVSSPQESGMSSAVQLLDIIRDLTHAHELFAKMEDELGHQSLQKTNRSSSSTPKSAGDSAITPILFSKSACSTPRVPCE